MGNSGRVIGFTSIVSIFVGLIVAFIVVLFSGEPRKFAEIPWDSLLVLAAVVSMPISLPMGVVGGIFAAKTLRKRGHSPGIADWWRESTLSGSLLGFLGTILWYLCINLLNGRRAPMTMQSLFELPAMLGGVGLIGAFSGAAVGTLVGIYCHRISRTMSVS